MLVKLAKSVIKRTISPTIDGLGLYDRELERLDNSNWLIVMYHRVIADPALDPFGLGMCVSREHFGEQIAYLRKNFTPIGMAQAAALIEQGRPLPDRSVSVTLDDGYLDNLEHALPILERHHMPATLFVPTGGIENDERLWWDRVIHAFASTRKTEVAPALAGLSTGTRLSLAPWSRAGTLELVLAALWERPLAETLERVADLERDLLPADAGPGGARRMNADQILEMHRRGIEIGAHTVNHPNLTLESTSSVRWEMETSRQTLQRLCDAEVSGFAYPAGWKNETTVAQARAAGFRYAVATTSGFSAPQRDLFSLSRVGMPDSAAADFKRALVSIARRSHALRAS
jgi:peptidoglycan/xylan/chitin deacetylase (PgdA/CDA1 family)